MSVCRLRTPVKLDAFVNDLSHTSSPVSPLRRVRRPISSGTLAFSSVSPETTTCPWVVVATCFDSPVPSVFASGAMSWPAPVAQTAFIVLMLIFTVNPSSSSFECSRMTSGPDCIGNEILPWYLPMPTV